MTETLRKAICWFSSTGVDFRSFCFAFWLFVLVSCFVFRTSEFSASIPIHRVILLLVLQWHCVYDCVYSAPVFRLGCS